MWRSKSTTLLKERREPPSRRSRYASRSSLSSARGRTTSSSAEVSSDAGSTMAVEMSGASRRRQGERGVIEVVRARMTGEPALGGTEPQVSVIDAAPGASPYSPAAAEGRREGVPRPRVRAMGPGASWLCGPVRRSPVGSRPTVGLRPTQPLSELGQVRSSTCLFRCRRWSGVSPPAWAASPFRPTTRRLRDPAPTDCP